MINRQIEELKRQNYSELPVGRKRYLNPFLLMSTTEALNKIAFGPPPDIKPIQYPKRTGLKPSGVTRQKRGQVGNSGSIPVGVPVSSKLKPTAIAKPVKEAVSALVPSDPLTRMANKNLTELSKDPFFKAGGGSKFDNVVRDFLFNPKTSTVDDTDTHGLAPLTTVAEQETIDTHHDVASRNQSGRNDPIVVPSISLPGTVGNQANLDQVFGAGIEGKSSEIQDLTPEDRGDETVTPDTDADRVEFERMKARDAQIKQNRSEGQKRRHRERREKEDKLKQAKAGVPGGGSVRPRPATTTGRNQLPTAGDTGGVRQGIERPLAEGVASAPDPVVSAGGGNGRRRRRRR